MDSRKIVEVLRATLDANQQQQAHDQLQQVRKVNEKLNNKIFSYGNQTHGAYSSFLALKILHFHCSFFIAQCTEP